MAKFAGAEEAKAGPTPAGENKVDDFFKEEDLKKEKVNAEEEKKKKKV